MSLIQHATVNCPFCKKEQEVQYYASVNVTIEPALKQKVIRGDLNQNECNNCHQELKVMSGLLYHDMAKGLMINLSLPGGTDGFDPADTPTELTGAKYIFRIVHSMEDLVEKIFIFDHNVNDKAISVFKKSFIQNFPDMDGKRINFVFNRVEKKFFSKKIVFVLFSVVEQMMEAKIETKKFSPDLFNLEPLRDGKWQLVENYSII